MNTTQLKYGLKTLGLEGDVMPYDRFTTSLFSDTQTQAYILNTGDSRSEGEHWVCFLNFPQSIEFFDSYGQRPDVYFKHLAYKKPIQYNNWWVQDLSSNYCGHHVLYFLSARCNKVSSLKSLQDSFYN